MPSGSGRSSVGGWKVEARRSRTMSASASTTVTEISWRASKSAKHRPTGPPPLMITSLSVGGLMIAGAAVAGDDGGEGIAIIYHCSAAAWLATGPCLRERLRDGG